MVVLDEQKKSIDAIDDDADNSLREERRRTGRYVAAGTAIFLSLLGLYQALARGTPEYAALFLPAVIMFVYVLWILYMSRKKLHRNLMGDDVLENNNALLDEVKVESSTPPPPPPEPATDLKIQAAESELTPQKPSAPVFKETNHTFSRSYSIA